MNKHNKPKRSLLDQQEHIAFELREYIDWLMKDLEAIRLLCIHNGRAQGASSHLDEEARLTTIFKKDAVIYLTLRFCNWYLLWGKRHLEKGWTVEQRHRYDKQHKRKHQSQQIKAHYCTESQPLQASQDL